MKSRIKGLIAILFSGLTALALALAYWEHWRAPADWRHSLYQTFRSPSGVALAMPILSILIFWRIHRLDRDGAIEGLKTRAGVITEKDRAEYADSAISRQAIYAAIGIGLIVGLTVIGDIWKTGSGPTQVVAFLTVLMLGLATLLSMISVMCYAQSHHWKPDSASPTVKEIRLELLIKASKFDRISWYLLLAGLIWAVALVDPVLSILANWIYGFLLWRYYFRFERKIAPAVRITVSADGMTQYQQTADKNVWRSQMLAIATTQLDDFIAKH